MRKLILHIGTEKTGTTSIQQTLLANKDDFAKQGVFIPTTPSGVSPNHRKLATAFMNKGKRDDSFDEFNIKDFQSWKQQTLKTIEAELLDSELETHILSSEHFSSRLVTKEEIQRLYEFLNKIYDEIKVVVYIRRQDEYAISLYSTYLKAGGDRKNILVSNGRDNRYDYYEMCHVWGNIFGKDNIDVRIFDRNKLKNGSVISDFSEIVGLDISTIKDAKKETNPSLTPLAQEILRLFNISIKNNADQYNLKWKMIEFLEKNYGGKPRLPQRDYVESWYSQFESSNDKLFEEYFDGEHSFSKEFEKYPESWPNIELSEIDHMAVMLEFVNFNMKEK